MRAIPRIIAAARATAAEEIAARVGKVRADRFVF